LSDRRDAADESRESAVSESARLMLQVDNIVEPGVPVADGVGGQGARLVEPGGP